MGSYPCFEKTRETGRHAVKKLPFFTLPDASNKTEIVEQIALEDERYQAAVKYLHWWRDFTFHKEDKIDD